MKKRWIILFLLTPSLLMAQTNGLTLVEIRAKVLAENPSVRESLQRIVAAQAVLKQARAAYLPMISLKGSYGHIDSDTHLQFDILNSHEVDFEQATVSVQANWILFDGFARHARSLSAKHGVQASRQLAANTKRLLILSATVAFREAQLAKENVQIAMEDYRFNMNLESDAKKRFIAGTLPEADVHNFSIQALQAENSVLAYKLSYETACTVLAELMALPNARLPETMRPIAINFDERGTVPDLDGEFEYALLNRPDLKALQSGLLSLDQRVRALKGDHVPRIMLVGEANYAENDGLSGVPSYDDQDSFVGVVAKWDLFSGGRKINAVKEAEASSYEAQEHLDALILSIRSALLQQIDAAETTQAVFVRQHKIRDLSVSVRNSVEKSYKVGAVSVTRLNEAQTNLVRARGVYASAYIAYQLILNQLDIETSRVLAEIKGANHES